MSTLSLTVSRCLVSAPENGTSDAFLRIAHYGTNGNVPATPSRTRHRPPTLRRGARPVTKRPRQNPPGPLNININIIFNVILGNDVDVEKFSQVDGLHINIIFNVISQNDVNMQSNE
ncbi:hypothetical protein [Adlercreutzia wanghongyangiae]|uniref:hypothetical protein n=1 Tax=Adlercreutzia wanghongyangiae TaxID=3111451 RepID=UPI002DBEE7F2|nr:hypothetical protein [Adlercreutzia sp. R21]